MKDSLKITLVQTSLVWEDIDANLANFSQKLAGIEPASTDLIVLPEMFSTGFTMNASAVAETMDGKAMKWLANTASQKRCVVTGSLVIKENGKYYNRLIWMRPDGTYEVYDKRHTFRMAGENKIYTGGNKKLIVELNGWKICPMICYDLRFPVWSRQPQTPVRTGTGGQQLIANSFSYDCLIYVANWPERRSYAWRHLLIGRAIENQAYVVGVNRIGQDGNGIEYPGYSVALSPKGEPLSRIIDADTVETVAFSYKKLEDFRREFPVALDADRFQIE